MNKLLSTLMAAVLTGVTFSAVAMDDNMKAMEAEPMSRSDDDIYRDTRMMMDGDKDGMISSDEFMAFNTGMFARMDANKDGMMDTGEQAMMMKSEPYSRSMATHK